MTRKAVEPSFNLRMPRLVVTIHPPTGGVYDEQEWHGGDKNVFEKGESVEAHLT